MLATMKRVYLHLACVFLLLFSQQVALSHLPSHATEIPRPQHTARGSPFKAVCAVCTAHLPRCWALWMPASPIHSVRHCVA